MHDCGQSVQQYVKYNSCYSKAVLLCARSIAGRAMPRAMPKRGRAHRSLKDDPASSRLPPLKGEAKIGRGEDRESAGLRTARCAKTDDPYLARAHFPRPRRGISASGRVFLMAFRTIHYGFDGFVHLSRCQDLVERSGCRLRGRRDMGGTDHMRRSDGGFPVSLGKQEQERKDRNEQCRNRQPYCQCT